MNTEPSLAASPRSPSAARSSAAEAPANRVRPGSLVTPFARALSLLEAFTPVDRWLSSKALAERCGMPASTTWRIAHSLVVNGYLLYDYTARKYRLTAAVLALGHGAGHDGGMKPTALVPLQACADLQSVHVLLGARDQLEIATIAHCRPAAPPPGFAMAPKRASLSSSPMGWALLSVLPESERCYLVHHLERRAPADSQRLRRQLGRAMAQVQERGYCTSVGDSELDVGIVSAPVLVEGRAPRVISCVCAASRFTAARVQRELGPRLLELSTAIQRSDNAV